MAPLLTILLATAGSIAALLAAGFAWERWSEARQAKLNPPPGQMVDVAGAGCTCAARATRPAPRW